MSDLKNAFLTRAIIISGLLMTALTSIFYFAEQLVGVAFPAFDVMDFLIRVLPGDIITFGIDRMVDVIFAFTDGEDLDTVAKNVESGMAIALFLGIGTAIGVGYFWLAKRLRERETFLKTEWATGLAVGLLLGVPTAIISAEYNVSASASTFVSTIWILIAALVWGITHNWIQRQMATFAKTEPLPTLRTEEPAAPMAGVASTAKPATVNVLDRRKFLMQVGGATAVITVAGVGLGRLLREGEVIEGGDLEIAQLYTGLEPAPGTRPEYTPLQDHYRIDINSGRTPNVDAETYRMPIRGLVNADFELSLDDIRNNYTSQDQFITIGCISNRIGGGLISTTRWTGVPMRDILADADLKPEGKFLRITSFDGFDEIVDVEMIMNDERIMLTYEWDGVPLPGKHGFPLRIYIPDRYGMKQPKWIEQMEVIEAWEEGYWVRRGWDAEAIVRTTSVIDTVAVDDVYEDEEGVMRVPIGGIAWAGAKGISKVEVQIDEGEWLQAELRQPLSDLTWVIWRLDWVFTPGEHTFTVRTYEADGTPQIAERADRRPSGATGYHDTEARVS